MNCELWICHDLSWTSFFLIHLPLVSLGLGARSARWNLQGRGARGAPCFTDWGAPETVKVTPKWGFTWDNQITKQPCRSTSQTIRADKLLSDSQLDKPTSSSIIQWTDVFELFGMVFLGQGRLGRGSTKDGGEGNGPDTPWSASLIPNYRHQPQISCQNPLLVSCSRG